MEPVSSSSSKQFVIVVKWGKEPVPWKWHIPLSSTNANITNIVPVFKQALYEHFGVPMARQKLLCTATKQVPQWKGLLKDDFDFSPLMTFATNNEVEEELHLLLMGSSETTKNGNTNTTSSSLLLEPPRKKTIFVEDLDSADQAAVLSNVEPAGLVNLGNTCYLNSVVQCLRAIPSLQTHLNQTFGSNYSSSSSMTIPTPTRLVGTALAETLAQLNRQLTPVAPHALVRSIKVAFPQFAQTINHGGHFHPMQQDAEECYSNLVALLATTTSTSSTTPSTTTNAVDAMFGLRLEETLTCDECPVLDTTTAASTTGGLAAEAPVVSTDWHRKLVCNIQGTADNSSSTAAGGGVNHVSDGIRLGLTGKIEKNSNVLNRNAIWTRQQRIAQLPLVLVVQFGRFYWKATPDSADHPLGVKCKVMKAVAFSDTLDVYEFCSSPIQTVLQTARTKAREEEDAIAQRKLLGTEVDAATTTSTTTANDTTADKDMPDANNNTMVEEEEDSDLQAALAMSMQTSSPKDEEDAAAAAAVLGPGFPPNFEGQYELFAVVTHKGRDADGGHYMAWVKADHSTSSSSTTIADTNVLNEDWFVFDDDEVSPCKTEDVLKLKGGGDWHMSYLNFYRVKK